MKKNISILFLLIGLSNCRNVAPKNEEALKEDFKFSRLGSQRDSLYLVLSIKQFTEKSVYPFDYDFYGNANKISTVIDTIVYSPDSLKLFSFAIISLPDSDIVTHGVNGI